LLRQIPHLVARSIPRGPEYPRSRFLSLLPCGSSLIQRKGQPELRFESPLISARFRRDPFGPHFGRQISPISILTCFSIALTTWPGLLRPKGSRSLVVVIPALVNRTRHACGIRLRSARFRDRKSSSNLQLSKIPVAVAKASAMGRADFRQSGFRSFWVRREV